MKGELNQKVLLKNTAGHYKDGVMNHVQEWEIVKVGRKYYTVRRDNQKWTDMRFYIEDRTQFNGDYSGSWKLYFSSQEILDEIESNDIYRSLSELFCSYRKANLNLEQLRRIQTIIKEDVL